MLKKCSNVLVCSDSEYLKSRYEEIAERLGITISTRYNNTYVHNYERIITDSGSLAQIPVCYSDRICIVLHADEDFIPLSRDVTSFVFCLQDDREVERSLYRILDDCPGYVSLSLTEEIDGVANPVFTDGRCTLDFGHGIYTYNEERISISPAQSVYLARWLLHGKKDSSKRKHLFDLRLKYGKDFLADVDRRGFVTERRYV